MRLLLHIGMSKTGTTALQRRLNECKAELAELGVLYPEPRHIPHCHNFLCAAYYGENGPRELSGGGVRSPETVLAMGEDYWRSLLQEVQESSAHTVLVSGEYFLGLPREGVRALAERLPRYFDDIRIICYVRDPAERYLSTMQQRIRSSHVTFRPKAYRMGATRQLFWYATDFPGSVQVRWFSRDQLISGDIVTDFSETFLPEASELLLDEVPHRANQSVSAVAMCVMQEFRRGAFPDEDGRPKPESDFLYDVLRHIDDGRPATAADLNTGLADLIRRNHRTDFIFLREVFGLKVPDEVTEDTPAPARDPRGATSLDLSEILAVEPRQVERLRSLAMKRFLAESIERRAAAAQGPEPGGNDE